MKKSKKPDAFNRISVNEVDIEETEDDHILTSNDTHSMLDTIKKTDIKEESDEKMEFTGHLSRNYLSNSVDLNN
jgi:hypothetical protein